MRVKEMTRELTPRRRTFFCCDKIYDNTVCVSIENGGKACDSTKGVSSVTFDLSLPYFCNEVDLRGDLKARINEYCRYFFLLLSK